MAIFSRRKRRRKKRHRAHAVKVKHSAPKPKPRAKPHPKPTAGPPATPPSQAWVSSAPVATARERLHLNRFGTGFTQAALARLRAAGSPEAWL
ncbi:MAG: hypothetical protein JWM40_1563, partial [Frankiales bacterium]|nr:hypothetical protein [Frankiales bacterium]